MELTLSKAQWAELIAQGIKAYKQNEGEYMSRQEAATMLGVTIRTIDGYCQDGILTKYELPNFSQPRLKRSEVEQLPRARKNAQ